MLLPGREWQEGYRFGFNGKEQDPEQLGQGNIYDYGFRIYNPRLGKFLSVDPLVKNYPWLTPYQFACNTPIIYIDFDGCEGTTPPAPSFVPALSNTTSGSPSSTDGLLLWTVDDGNGGTTTVHGPFKDQQTAQSYYDTQVSYYGMELTIGTDGMIVNPKIASNRITNLEKGSISSNLEGIILHRTVSSTSTSTLQSFKNKGVGTHFLVGKNGVIYQTASLDKRTAHLLTAQLKKGSPKNFTSIGIEVVGNYSETTKTWEPLTPEQAESVAWLVNSLLKTYDLSREDIFNHEDIQPKTAGEGGIVRAAINEMLITIPTQTAPVGGQQ